MRKILTIDQKFDKALVIITNYEIKAAYLARLLGIERASMNNKLKGHAYDRFTEDQKILIINHLLKLGKETECLN